MKTRTSRGLGVSVSTAARRGARLAQFEPLISLSNFIMLTVFARKELIHAFDADGHRRAWLRQKRARPSPLSIPSR